MISARLRRFGLYVAMIVIVCVFVLPLLWFLLLALRPADADPLSVWFVPDLSAFHYVFVSPGEGLAALVSSLIQAGLATLVALPLAILASYALTRFEYRGRELVGMWYLGLMLAPPVVFVIPMFVVMSRLGIIGGDLALVLAYQTFAIPLGVLLMRGFFQEIPKEIEEGAMMDGCGRARILLLIVLPMVRPGLLVAGIFVFCFCWNNLVFALPLTGGETVPLTVRALSFFATSGISWNYIAATASVSMVVPMLLFWIFRRHLVAGLTFGAVKG